MRQFAAVAAGLDAAERQTWVRTDIHVCVADTEPRVSDYQSQYRATISIDNADFERYASPAVATGTASNVSMSMELNTFTTGAPGVRSATMTLELQPSKCHDQVSFEHGTHLCFPCEAIFVVGGATLLTGRGTPDERQ
jgi:hypothetical protein